MYNSSKLCFNCINRHPYLLALNEIGVKNNPTGTKVAFPTYIINAKVIEEGWTEYDFKNNLYRNQ